MSAARNFDFSIFAVHVRKEAALLGCDACSKSIQSREIIQTHAQSVYDPQQLVGVIAVCRLSVVFDKKFVLLQLQGTSELAVELRAAHAILVGLRATAKFGPPHKRLRGKKFRPFLLVRRASNAGFA
jgi:hypothetical protein